MKLLTIILTLAMLTLLSCGDNVSYAEGSLVKEKIGYFKDSRTGFCFAERYFGEKYGFTCVECTEEVEKLIGEKTEFVVE